MKTTEVFQKWLHEKPDPWKIGQIVILPGYLLRHQKDISSDSLKQIANLKDWETLIRFNVNHQFRPLKAAPDLLSGWEYGPLSFSELFLALEYLYPVALTNWNLYQLNQLTVTSYEETAARQTGRFAIVKNLTHESKGQLIDQVCEQNCLKQRLWLETLKIKNGISEIPLLCPEACNYFVSKARESIKGETQESFEE